MTQSLRVAIAIIIGTTAFFAAALGIEFLSWYWISPGDPLADPAANALRLVASAVFAVAIAWRAMRRERIVLNP